MEFKQRCLLGKMIFEKNNDLSDLRHKLEFKRRNMEGKPPEFQFSKQEICKSDSDSRTKIVLL